VKGDAVPDDLSGRTVLAVFAHPDDESLACGGTLARLADAGANVVLLCASRGERGSISEPELVPDGNLAAARSRELVDAAAALRIGEVVIMDHPDGDLRWDDVPELHREIVALVDRHQPAAVITFAEDGLYWHLDHIGVHERTYTAVRSFGDAAPPLYYVTMPKGMMRALAEAAHARGAARDSGFWGIEPDAFGDCAAPATITIDVRPWIGRKLAALRCHRTQLGIDNPLTWIDEDEARDWLGTEYFRRAQIAGRDESPLEQLGEPVRSTE
jgi:N-acetyl-1-D-myo-inositol-2-amino-2-deoxy-alpha-D-glucopyranoside deacetylase